ncbi:aminotransferase-like domain-containing protein [Spiribacter halobius]|uniref:GntR family transcriptional regulator n=1 Tax=Sediminicurvatus halobius TaxID=2182432 RepID=A0A2U2MYF1_9GAMM|nr:PLP-dependent aminotransferase family protein [Spiribacter halobius]PWG61827.1 GntR family transcriptional regulator [Spiribacter halobius]UEX77669.1 PLP-dependent aminotransferase family protein [Spiribacter halobius]
MSKPYRYENVAEALRAAITRGPLRGARRLPGVRVTAKQFGVSRNTVIHAYRILEREGLIRPQAQRGFYVTPRNAAPAVSWAPLPEQEVVRRGRISARVASLDLDPRVVSFGSALPAPELLPVAAFRQSMRRATRYATPRSFAVYSEGAGAATLLEALAKRHENAGVMIPAEELIVTNGAMDGINLVLEVATRPGDSVIVPTPAYRGFLHLLELKERHVIEVDGSTSSMDFGCLERLFARDTVKAMLVGASHANPTGLTVREADRRKLAELAARYQVTVIEDDVLGELHFGAQRPQPIKAWDTNGWVVWASSNGKTLGPGNRIGWLAPGRWFEKVLAMRHASSRNGPPTLLQLAVADFLDSGESERHLARFRPRLASQMRVLREAVLRHFPAETTVSEPEGGLSLWVELPALADGTALFHRAVSERITLLPGELFSPSGAFGNCIRLTAGAPWSATREEAIQRLGRWAAESTHDGMRAALAG